MRPRWAAAAEAGVGQGFLLPDEIDALVAEGGGLYDRMLAATRQIRAAGISCPPAVRHTTSWENCLPVMSGKRAFLELLKQEGVEILFGNPGTTELPLMDALAVDNEMRYVLGLQEAAVMAMADGYAQASGKLAVVNLHVAPGLGNAMGMLYDAQKAASPILVTAGQHEQNFTATEPILWADLPTDRAADGEMVERGASPGRPAAARASCRQDRAGAADRAGVPLAAGRHPQRRSRYRPDGADAHRAAHARRPRRDRGGRGGARQGASGR